MKISNYLKELSEGGKVRRPHFREDEYVIQTDENINNSNELVKVNSQGRDKWEELKEDLFADDWELVEELAMNI